MKVYFKNANRIRREIGSADTNEEVFAVIRKFLDEHNYKAPYWRTWTLENGETHIDVGSHTELFIVKE